jgi:hypothetical protein
MMQWRHAPQVLRLRAGFRKSVKLLWLGNQDLPTKVFGSGRVPLDKVEGFVKGRDVLSGE